MNSKSVRNRGLSYSIQQQVRSPIKTSSKKRMSPLIFSAANIHSDSITQSKYSFRLGRSTISNWYLGKLRNNNQILKRGVEDHKLPVSSSCRQKFDTGIINIASLKQSIEKLLATPSSFSRLGYAMKKKKKTIPKLIYKTRPLLPPKIENNHQNDYQEVPKVKPFKGKAKRKIRIGFEIEEEEREEFNYIPPLVQNKKVRVNAPKSSVFRKVSIYEDEMTPGNSIHEFTDNQLPVSRLVSPNQILKIGNRQPGNRRQTFAYSSNQLRSEGLCSWDRHNEQRFEDRDNDIF